MILYLKLRTMKFARAAAYDELYSGDPTFITTSMAGMGNDGRHRVTKNGLPFPKHIGYNR